MSNEIFPVGLAGEGWPVKRRILTSTIIKTSAAGIETRIANYAEPRDEWEIPFNVLDASKGELQALQGFYEARMGAFDSFLYRDETDCLVTGQVVGTGDGATKAFQLVRARGGSQRNIYAVNGVIASYPSSAAPSRKVYFGTEEQTSGWTISTDGVLTFSSAPANSTVIKADFAYFWRVRFSEEAAVFENFVQYLWEAKQIALKGVRA